MLLSLQTGSQVELDLGEKKGGLGAFFSSSGHARIALLVDFLFRPAALRSLFAG